MITLFVLSLAVAEVPLATPPGCELDAPVRDPALCEPIYDDGTFVIYNMESVAVGSIEEMERVREMTRHCNAANRIDHLGAVDLGVYDIVNADDNSRKCVTEWIKENTPDLKYSKQKFTERFRSAPLLETEPVIIK